MMVRDRTVLPEPLSPTIPIVCPGCKEKLTPSTARRRPAPIVKWVLRFSTVKSGSARGGVVASVTIVLIPFLARGHGGFLR